MITDRFVTLGSRIFSSGAWHRAPFQPIIYLMLWGAVLRIVADRTVPAPFQQTLSSGGEMAWILLVLICPPLSLFAWWLIMRARWLRSSLIGLWLRLASDAGMCCALLVFHIADALDSYRTGEEPADFLSRYITAAVVLFSFLLVVRDVWALVLTGKVARSLGREAQ